MDIPLILTSIEGALRITSQLKDIDRGVDEAEFKLQIAELKSFLAEAKLGLVDQQMKIASLEAQLTEMKRRREFAEGLHSHKGFKFEVIDGAPVGWPFCPPCEVKLNEYHRLIHPSKADLGMRGEMQCPGCKKIYGYPVPNFPYPE